ncbi:MAG: hypothetical protein WCC59_03950 [Terriglobales bacterium]
MGHIPKVRGGAKWRSDKLLVHAGRTRADEIVVDAAGRPRRS